MKIRLGLVDSDQLYLKRLTEFFVRKYSGQIEVSSFTELKDAERMINENRINVLVASTDSSISAENIPDSCMFAYFSESAEIEKYNGCAAVFRYQKAEDIYRKLLGFYSEKTAGRIKFRNSEGRARISLFVPECEGAGAFTAAAAFSEYSASAERKTLFLNLRQTHTSEKLFASSGDSTFTDVIFAVKSRKANMRLRLESIVRKNRNGVYFFGDCRNPLDCTELNADELLFLLNELSTGGGYDNIAVVSDFYVSDNFAVLLENSDDVIIVSGNSQMTEKRLSLKKSVIEGIEKRKQICISDRLKVIFNRSEREIFSGIQCLGVVPDSCSGDENDAVRTFIGSDIFRPLTERAGI